MLIKVDLLTLISEDELVTAYFFDADNKIIFAQSFCDQKSLRETDLKLLRDLIDLLEAEILYIELGQSVQTAGLNILTKDKSVVKIEVTLKMAVCLAGLYDLVVFIEHETLYKEGIMVTKELIEDTLQC